MSHDVPPLPHADSLPPFVDDVYRQGLITGKEVVIGFDPHLELLTVSAATVYDETIPTGIGGWLTPRLMVHVATDGASMSAGIAELAWTFGDDGERRVVRNLLGGELYGHVQAVARMVLAGNAPARPIEVQLSQPARERQEQVWAAMAKDLSRRDRDPHHVVQVAQHQPLDPRFSHTGARVLATGTATFPGGGDPMTPAEVEADLAAMETWVMSEHWPAWNKTVTADDLPPVPDYRRPSDGPRFDR